MQESYHSLNGAVQESMHVFIESGLKRVIKTHIRVLEIGFGTGLNALLTWQNSVTHKQAVSYDTLEAFPVSPDLLSDLKYTISPSDLPNDAFEQIHLAPWGVAFELEPNCFILKKIQTDFTTYQFENRYDLMYMDAFAPDKQSEMWDECQLAKLYGAMEDWGILVTYCAKGEIRRRLQRVGFHVERIPGPPGKREMLRAQKLPI